MSDPHSVDVDVPTEDAIIAALDHADTWRAYRHARVGAFVGRLREAGFKVVPAVSPLVQALIEQHRGVVGDTSGNMGGHVAIRDGWLDPGDPPWADVTPEACSVCDLIRAAS